MTASMTDEPTKVCAGCHRELPRARYTTAKARRDGLSAKCKDCFAAYMRAWVSERKRRAALTRKRMGTTDPRAHVRVKVKKCACCGEVRSAGVFHLSYKTADYLQDRCRDCAARARQARRAREEQSKNLLAAFAEIRARQRVRREVRRTFDAALPAIVDAVRGAA